MPEWTVRQQKYQLWLAAPAAARPEGLRTRQELADKLVISPMTLRNWERLPGWWDAVFEQARAVVGREIGSILKAVVREAKAGSVQAAKLCLQVLGVHAEKIQHEVDVHQDQLILILHPAALPAPPAIPQLPQSNIAHVEEAQLVIG